MDHTREWTHPHPQGASRVSLVSAYWDKRVCERAAAASRGLIGPIRLLLWTAGASRSAWEALRVEHGELGIDLRFVDSPATGGIFHVKLAAIEAADGRWLRALVGSANLTTAAYEKNVELGVVVEDAVALEPLRAWFVDQYAHATPAGDIDWDRAIATAPVASEANERRALFAHAALASPARVPSAGEE